MAGRPRARAYPPWVGVRGQGYGEPAVLPLVAKEPACLRQGPY